MMFEDDKIYKNESRSKPQNIEDGLQWLNDIKKRLRKDGRFVETIFLTPSRARALLSVNPDNRRVNTRTVETYASDIANGRWTYNGQTIIVADTGELNDGQHRCEAVVLAGKGIEVLLVAGVPRETRTTVDMGRVRTTGDFLHMHNVENSNQVAAAAQMILAFEGGRIMGDQRGVAKSNSQMVNQDAKPTKQEVLLFARENMDDITRAMSAIHGAKAGVVSSASRMVGILCILARHSRDWADAIDYIAAVVEGDNLKKMTPEYTVRERLLSEKRTGKLGPVAFMEIVIRGWNARRARQKLQVIKLHGYLPEVSR